MFRGWCIFSLFSRVSHWKLNTIGVSALPLRGTKPVLFRNDNEISAETVVYGVEGSLLNTITSISGSMWDTGGIYAAMLFDCHSYNPQWWVANTKSLLRSEELVERRRPVSFSCISRANISIFVLHMIFSLPNGHCHVRFPYLTLHRQCASCLKNYHHENMYIGTWNKIQSTKGAKGNIVMSQ